MEDRKVNNSRIGWKNKKVLITGYAGFLGSWLTKTLLDNGAVVVGVDKVASRVKGIIGIEGDITNLSFINGVVNAYKPSIVLHVGAEAIVGEALKKPVRGFKTNIEGTWNILDSLRGKKFVKCVIVASSDKAYGIQKKLPYKETAPLAGCHPYDVSKSCADLLTYTYFYTYYVPACITRCGNIFGPGDRNFSRIVPDAISSALQDKTLIIRSDGKYTRDYIYIEDIIDGYLLLAEKSQTLKLSGEAFNFSNEKPISVIKLVETIYRLIGKKPKYKVLNQAKYEIRDQYLSSQKARKILGWKPRYSLEEGLAKTIEWYRKYFEKGCK
jgi:CDP-glucose 4,6-dehydratase